MYPDPQQRTPQKSGGMKFRHMLLLLGLALVGGAGLFAWLAHEYGYLQVGEVQPNAAVTNELPKAAPPAATPGLILPVPSNIPVADANRAEALMIAAAARRAVDAGAPLGHLHEKLQAHFGAAEPISVNVIRKFEANPVTLSELKFSLERLNKTLGVGSSEEGLWKVLQREMSGLFVLRKGGKPPEQGNADLAKAIRFLESGNVVEALSIVQVFAKTKAGTEKWQQDAERYTVAQLSLDQIERAAMAIQSVSAPTPVILPEPGQIGEQNPAQSAPGTLSPDPGVVPEMLDDDPSNG